MKACGHENLYEYCGILQPADWRHKVEGDVYQMIHPGTISSSNMNVSDAGQQQEQEQQTNNL